MPDDPEIRAMTAMVEALEDLDQSTRERVIEWTAHRYDVTSTAGSRIGRLQPGGGEDADDGELGDDEASEFADFADLYDALNPKQDVDRALAGGYWFQVIKGAPSFTGLQVNNALKDLGHGLDNVARALANLQSRSPALVRQMSKSGRSKQARKTYKLTSGGINVVAKQLAG